MKKYRNIQEIIPGKKYRITFEKGRKNDGSRNRISLTFNGSLKEAIEKRDELLYEVRHKNLKPDGCMNFLEYTRLWLKEYAEPNVRPTTLYSYRCNLNAYILPRFKNYRLNEISALDLTQFYKELSKRPTKVSGRSDNPKVLSGTTILKQHRLLNLMFNLAIKWNFLDVNPCSKVIRPPRKSSTEVEFYSEEEIKQILRGLDNEEIGFKTAIYMLLFSGVRRGELLALKKSDFDEEKHTVNISKNLLSIRGAGLVESDTKTPGSHRKICIPDVCFKLLNEYEIAKVERKKLLGSKYLNSNYVFQSVIGGSMRPDWLSSEWSKFIKRNNIRYLSLHSLRHTFATYLISLGTPISTVSKKLGHSDAYTTLAFYTGSVAEDDMRSSELLESKLLK